MHRGLKLTDVEFDAMKRCLRESLYTFSPSIEDYIVSECLWAFELLRKKIVQRSLAQIVEEKGFKLSDIEQDLANRLYADEKVRKHLENKLSPEELHRHTKIVLTFFLHASQIGYRNKDLQIAHRPLGISEEAWTAFEGHMLEVFREKNLGEQLEKALKDALKERKSYIICLKNRQL
jgi:hypothetical protein